jgi:hypothetical protein
MYTIPRETEIVVVDWDLGVNIFGSFLGNSVPRIALFESHLENGSYNSPLAL